MDRVIIFDTTLRDGEQAAGGSMNLQEKLEIARQLEKLGVDVIEAGFPISSPGDFEAVSLIAREISDRLFVAWLGLTPKMLTAPGKPCREPSIREYMFSYRLQTFIFCTE